ncbi:uncharacterized protein LOC123559795 isoform X1 [Mercenaria mercenaria]|uniref:uncharacterized protein LOC123559795 isoform X1 n=1 Tax=Mercenaria mercenaria TaxID=6596 RepID=UPI00234F6980|nr:uncharacterized protein LOC123559795 isoform X1 [Mercenaria mercenaria]XP_053408223.1 uncharacterized protein LOC123559795 isoform X1 [Mercenaria mercenaria]
MMLSFACILLYAGVHVQGLGRTILDGDVFIEFIAAIYVESGNDSNSSCSKIEAETVQNIQAIKWTLSNLNEANYIPNLKIGLRVSQTCKKEGEAERLALKLSAELYNVKEANVVGVIGSDYSSETEAISRLLSSLPEEYRLLQVGFSSTSASLRNRDNYKNFFRTIPPDDIQVEVMIKYIEALNWTYMAIIYDDDAYGQGGKDELLNRSRGLDVCFPAMIPVDALHYNRLKLETDIKDKVIAAEVPINGILVFGSSVLADLVLVATETVLEETPNASRPVFLFSEAGGYIQGHHTNVSKGAFVLSPPRRIIESFQDEWTTIFTDTTRLYQEIESNTWIRDVYNSSFNCKLADRKDDNNCSPLSESEFKSAVPDSVYNQYAIQAAMVISAVVKNIYKKKCPNQLAACDSFTDTYETPRYEFVKELSQISQINFDDFSSFRLKEFQSPDLTVSFGDSCEIRFPDVFPVYEVYNHQILCNTGPYCLVKVAEYKNSKELEITRSDIKDYDVNGEEVEWPNIRKAQCPDDSLCLSCYTEKIEDFVLYIPGDMYLIGIVPVHNKGTTPLQCGSIKKGGLDFVETIRFAVAEAKTKPAANIGIIIIDSCNDPQIIQEKILTLHRLGVYIDGQYRPVGDKIIGYIGGWSSDVSIAVAEITSRLQYPQITYASTAPVLSKRLLYPYLLRVPSPDEKQAETILELVKRLNGNFIQILYSQSVYGESGRDILLDLIGTSEFDLCVAQTLPVSRNSNKDKVLADLRKFPQAKSVVLFLGSFEIEYMIGTFNTINKNEFLFISSEGWGTRINVSEYRNMAGSLTITSQLTINEKLTDHVKQLKPDGSNVDSWIRPYMENEFQCYFQWSYNKTSGKPCSGNESLDVYKTEFRLDAWTSFAERAVTALLEGVEKALRATCSGNTAVLCSNYRNSTDLVYEEIKNYERLGSSGFRTRVFDDNGDGTAGYQIYVVSKDTTGKAEYKKIGDSSLIVDKNSVDLTFQSSLYNSVRGEIINSTCSSNIDVCNQCFAVPVGAEAANDLSAGVIVVIVLLGIICCVLAGILLFICNRHGCCLRIENGRPKFTGTYLTPIYARERRAHGVDGQDSPHQEENYDSIPISGGISYSRPPTSDGGSSGTGKTISGGSQGDSGAGINTSQIIMGRDNVAFENDSLSSSQQVGSSSGVGSSVRGNSSIGPTPHHFTKPAPAPAPAPPARGAGVVYQADGSYITASTNSEAKISGGSAAGTQTDVDRTSKSSDRSLGYLRSVQVNEDNRV